MKEFRRVGSTPGDVHSSRGGGGEDGRDLVMNYFGIKKLETSDEKRDGMDHGCSAMVMVLAHPAVMLSLVSKLVRLALSRRWG